METIRSSETSVNKISTRRHIPEDGILHSHRRENLKSYILMFRRKFAQLHNYFHREKRYTRYTVKTEGLIML
jgi:hypothetical protein